MSSSLVKNFNSYLRVTTVNIGSKSYFEIFVGFSIFDVSPSSTQADGALGEPSDESDFSLLVWDSFSQEIRNLLLFYCQKSLNLLQMQ